MHLEDVHAVTVVHEVEVEGVALDELVPDLGERDTMGSDSVKPIPAGVERVHRREHHDSGVRDESTECWISRLVVAE